MKDGQRNEHRKQPRARDYQENSLERQGTAERLGATQCHAEKDGSEGDNEQTRRGGQNSQNIYVCEKKSSQKKNGKTSGVPCMSMMTVVGGRMAL